MTNLLSQFVLAARNNRGDDKGWVQLLVFVLIAAFYGLGGLLKAKAAKREQQWNEEDEEGWEEVEKPQEPRQAPAQTYRTAEPPKPPQPKPAVKKAAARIEFKKLAALKKKEQASVKRKSLAVTETEKQADQVPQPAAESIFNIEETDELRRAIIFSEILAKPIALRHTP